MDKKHFVTTRVAQIVTAVCRYL